ncbi:hypothetical protein P8452_37855 [Trifolium repens]|jgi:hypothetical protein|nr:hypothetical protein P8452_37855 [Trifolium repens]
MVTTEQGILEGQEIALRSDKGKGTAVDTTPTASPLRIGTSRVFGISSSNIDSEIKEMFSIKQPQIASLVESDQRQQAMNENVQKTLAQILSVLCTMQQQQQPKPNP